MENLIRKIKTLFAWVGLAALVIVGLFIARDVWARQGAAPGWVNAVKPKPAVIVATPTLAPHAPEAAPAQATAVPQPQPAAIPATMVPVIVNDVQPAPQPAEPMVNIAAGAVTETQAQFLADCAYGQATGARVSPNCPANAGAMLGQGR